MFRQKDDYESALSLHQQACALYDTGDRTGAMAALVDLVGQHPTYYYGWCSLAKSRIEAKDYAGALDAARRAIGCAPGKVAAHINAGIALRCLGDLVAAQQEFELAISCTQYYPLAHLELGRVLAARGHPPEAIPHFLRAIAHASNDAEHAPRIIADSITALAAIPATPDLPPNARSFIVAAAAIAQCHRAKAVAILTPLRDSDAEEEQLAARDLIAHLWTMRRGVRL